MGTPEGQDNRRVSLVIDDSGNSSAMPTQPQPAPAAPPEELAVG